MDKLLRILIPIILLIVLAAVCSIGGSGLLDNTSHVIAAQTSLESVRTIRYMAGTIDRQSTSLVVALVVMAATLLGVTIFAGRMVWAARGAGSGGSAWRDSSGAPQFISLGQDARARLARLRPAQKRALLDRLYAVCSWLEQDLGRGQKSRDLAVYEQVEDRPITWG